MNYESTIDLKWSGNNRSYDPVSLKHAVEEFNKKSRKICTTNECGIEIDLEKASHEIINVTIEDTVMKVTGRTLKTPAGLILEQVLRNSVRDGKLEGLGLVPSGIGRIEGKVVVDYEIVNFVFVHEPVVATETLIHEQLYL